MYSVHENSTLCKIAKTQKFCSIMQETHTALLEKVGAVDDATHISFEHTT